MKIKIVLSAFYVLMLAALACSLGPTPAPNNGISIETALTLAAQTFTALAQQTSAVVATIATPLPSTGNIRGTVRDDQGPVSGAQVQALSSGLSTVTDNQGQYILADVPAGEESIMVQEASHAAVFQSVTVEAGVTITVDFVLSRPPATQVASPTFTPIPTPTLDPFGYIQGTVKDNTGPVSGAKVEAQISGKKTVTNNNGQFSFNNLQPGEEFITVEEAAHIPDFQAVTVRRGQIINVEIGLAKGIGGPCGQRGALAGRVLFNGNPVVKASVGIWNEADPVETNNKGRYKIENTCGGLMIVEWKGIRKALVVKINPNKTKTMPDIILP